LRVAILGTRGVPANYGGFETFAEQLGKRLVQSGHQVTVYGRDRFVPRRERTYLGMRIVRLPAPQSKYFETVIHTLFAAFHALTQRYDVIYVCNSANVPAVILLRMFGKRVVLNVDGLEWKRRKWSGVGRAYYRACAWTAAKLPVHVVTDALVIQHYYQTAYGRRTTYFPYGTELDPVADDGTLARLGLEPGRYVLYVSRLEPENNAHVVIEAYRSVKTDLPLAVVGDAPYASSYIASLRATTDPRVRFLGAVYGVGYQVLRSHATAYVQATEVGGTHPALVEAMGFGNVVLANDVPEHRETLGDGGLYYRGPMELAARLQEVLDDRALSNDLRRRAHDRARRLYSWDAISASYEKWLTGLCPAPQTPGSEAIDESAIPSVDIAGLPIHNVSFDQAVTLITRWASDGSGGTVYTPNVDDVVKAHRQADFRAAVMRMRLRVPDGMGVIYGSRIAGTPLRGTVTGRLLPEALAAALGPSVGIAIFGGKPGAAQAAGRVLESKGAHIAAALAPEMGFVVGSEEDLRLTKQLKDSGAGLIFVCLGAPRQALWMARHAAELPAVLVGVGAAVDVLAGKSPSAPAWMTRLGVEWAFRIYHEPRRLTPRYLWDDPRFFWWMIQERAERRRARRTGGAVGS
jgi:exopolysaccharide biosynthesis WecB/TagA/CpsF family protein